LHAIFGFPVCVGASRNWIFHYLPLLSISVRRGNVCNVRARACWYTSGVLL